MKIESCKYRHIATLRNIKYVLEVIMTFCASSEFELIFSEIHLPNFVTNRLVLMHAVNEESFLRKIKLLKS